jgi:hypothetical protein
VHLLRHVVKCTVTDLPFSTPVSLLKCPPSTWINFLTRDQRTYNLTKHCSVVDASCSTENLPELFSRVHLVCIHHSFHVTPHVVT